MFNPYKNYPDLSDFYKDATTGESVKKTPASLKEMKKLCDPYNNLEWVEKCMNNIPDFRLMLEENSKGLVIINPELAEKEEQKEALLKRTFNRSNVFSFFDQKVAAVAFLTCTNMYYKSCSENYNH